MRERPPNISKTRRSIRTVRDVEGFMDVSLTMWIKCCVCKFSINYSPIQSNLFLSQVTATDVDSGDFGQVTYSIVAVSDGQEGKFDIDRNVGQLYVTQPVQRGERYIVTVAATDDNGATHSRYDCFLSSWRMYFTIFKGSEIVDEGNVKEFYKMLGCN